MKENRDVENSVFLSLNLENVQSVQYIHGRIAATNYVTKNIVCYLYK